jgi:uncharacterized membrane protein YccC
MLADMPHPRDLPANVINGIGVALGIACLQVLATALFGAHAAQLVLSGAVCTSLADTPNPAWRTGYRVAAAAALSTLAALVVALLRGHPAALGMGIGAIGLAAMLTLSWGPRAGAVSFAPILALVFAMAVPASPDALWRVGLQVAGWSTLGGLAYVAWAMASARILQTRYRALGMAQALDAAAELLRARANLLRATDADGQGMASMQAWVQGEAVLAERLQFARDLVFADTQADSGRGDPAVLLRLIDLRDVLLASRLDLDRVGGDERGRNLLHAVAGALDDIAQGLEDAASRRRTGSHRLDPGTDPPDLARHLGMIQLPDADPRSRLVPVLQARLREMAEQLTRVRHLLAGGAEAAALDAAQLQPFVGPEGWPWQSVRAQLTLASPVLRHALRFALALSTAYGLALVLPWASHPHWLVLSVAVVLRGNLEQTLSRRNARVAGTLLGCGVVVMLSGTRAAPLLPVVFLMAVGTAHASVLTRYWLTALAATVMALLQAHTVDPSSGFAVAERVADTHLGAALAWAFSFVLPAWERRLLPGTVDSVERTLAAYASHALQRDAADPVAQRLARRQAYDALGQLGAALQRSGAEPRRVRVPAQEVATLLDHGQRLMAHLSLVRMALSRADDPSLGDAARLALGRARQALARALAPGSTGLSIATTAEAPALPLAESTADPEDLSQLPLQAPEVDIVPWLERRLRVLVSDAHAIRGAADRVRSRLGGPD